MNEDTQKELVINDFGSIERFEAWKNELAEIDRSETAWKEEQEKLRILEKEKKSCKIESVEENAYKIPRFMPYGEPEPTFYPDKDGFVRQRINNFK